MRTAFQIPVILLTIIAFGAGKLHFEDRLNHDMVEQRLIQPPLAEGAHLELGQTGAAVALGGLRSLVAAIWNLRAFLYFEDLDWIKLEQSYGIITTLQPQNIHYWKTGAWHLHTNAAVYFKENQELSPFRRNALQKKYIQKGAEFLEEGIRHNPDSWELHTTLAQLKSNPFKFPDLNLAIKHYDAALACNSLPSYRRNMFERFRFYTMTRIPSRRAEALQEGLKLYYKSPQNRTPSLVNYIFALQNALHVSKEKRIPDNQLYPNKKLQLQWLKNLWKRRNEGFPVDGVYEKIEELTHSKL